MTNVCKCTSAIHLECQLKLITRVRSHQAQCAICRQPYVNARKRFSGSPLRTDYETQQPEDSASSLHWAMFFCLGMLSIVLFGYLVQYTNSNCLLGIGHLDRPCMGQQPQDSHEPLGLVETNHTPEYLTTPWGYFFSAVGQPQSARESGVAESDESRKDVFGSSSSSNSSAPDGDPAQNSLRGAPTDLAYVSLFMILVWFLACMSILVANNDGPLPSDIEVVADECTGVKIIRSSEGHTASADLEESRTLSSASGGQCGHDSSCSNVCNALNTLGLSCFDRLRLTPRGIWTTNVHAGFTFATPVPLL